MNNEVLPPALRELRHDVNRVYRDLNRLREAQAAVLTACGLSDPTSSVVAPPPSVIRGLDPAIRSLRSSLRAAEHKFRDLRGASQGRDVPRVTFYDRIYRETTYDSAVHALLAIGATYHANARSSGWVTTFFGRAGRVGMIWAELLERDTDARDLAATVFPVSFQFDLGKIMGEVDGLFRSLAAEIERKGVLDSVRPVAKPTEGFFFRVDGSPELRGQLARAFRRDSMVRRILIALLQAREELVAAEDLLECAYDDQRSADRKNLKRLSDLVTDLRRKLAGLAQPYDLARIPDGQDGAFRIELPPEHVYELPTNGSAPVAP